MTDHISILLLKVLKAYGVTITQHTIKRTILSHPDYPSMRCISDAFDKWRIKHVVVKLPLEKLRLLDVPVISYLKKGEYVWVTQITEKNVHFFKSTGKEKIEKHERFEKQWSRVALVIKDIDNSGEPNYREERLKEMMENIIRYVFEGSCIVLLTALTCFSWSNDALSSLFTKIILIWVSAAGCFISYLLILQEKRQSNKFVQKFCKSGEHIDCNKVTASRYSKLFDMISWAELGMAYFGTVIIWIFIAPLSTGWLSPLWWIFLASLPFTVWSLFTQAFLIRK